MSHAQSDDIPVALRSLVDFIIVHTRGSRYWARRSEIIRVAKNIGYTETDVLLAANYVTLYEYKAGKHVMWTRYMPLTLKNPYAYKRTPLDRPTKAPKRKAYRPAPRFYAIPCGCQNIGCQLCLSSL